MTTATSNGKSTTPPEMTLPPLQIEHVTLKLVGISPLIVNRFSEKARRMMEDKQAKKATAGRAARDPEADFLGSMYVVPGREDMEDFTPGKYYFPGIAFKAAAIGACRFLDDKQLNMTRSRGLFFVDNDPILDFTAVAMRTDSVRNASGVADLRYRAEYQGWSVNLDVSFNSRAVTLEQILNLFNVGGFSVGVGEWRPEKDGESGRFQVAEVTHR